MMQVWNPYPGQTDYTNQQSLLEEDISDENERPFRHWLMFQVYKKRMNKQVEDLNEAMDEASSAFERMQIAQQVNDLENDTRAGFTRIRLLNMYTEEEIEHLNLERLDEENYTTGALNFVVKVMRAVDLNDGREAGVESLKNANKDVYMDNYFRFKTEILDNRPLPMIEWDKRRIPEYYMTYGYTNEYRCDIMDKWNIRYEILYEGDDRKLYSVYGQRDAETIYQVSHRKDDYDNDEWDCTCEHFVRRLAVYKNSCKHILYMMKMELGLLKNQNNVDAEENSGENDNGNYSQSQSQSQSQSRSQSRDDNNEPSSNSDGDDMQIEEDSGNDEESADEDDDE